MISEDYEYEQQHADKYYDEWYEQHPYSVDDYVGGYDEDDESDWDDDQYDVEEGNDDNPYNEEY